MNSIERKLNQAIYELKQIECTDSYAKTCVIKCLEELNDLIDTTQSIPVVFSTNIDNYNSTRPFPADYTFVPRKGESVSVTDVFTSYYRDKGLPTKLEVVGITYYENRVVCELHYSENDVRLANLSGINLY